MRWFEFFAPLFKGTAYLDPGSGSIILQILIATLLGGAFLIKTYWTKLRTFFARLFSGKGNKRDQEQ